MVMVSFRRLERLLKGGMVPGIMRAGSLMDPRDRLLSLVLIGLSTYMLVALLTSTVFWDLIGQVAGPHTDLTVYRMRGDLLLEGKLPYDDFQCESPPLVILFFVLPQLAGGSPAAYSVEFGAIAMIMGLLVYFILRSRPGMAYASALLIMLSPATWITGSILLQDEVIVALFYLIPILILARGMRDLSSGLIVLGSLTKVYSAFITPLVLFRDGDWRERVRHLLIMFAIGGLILLPLAIADIGATVTFLEFYINQSASDLTTGISLWHFLYQAGIEVPTSLLTGAMLAGVGLIWFLSWWRRMDPLLSGFLLILPFLLFFPKIHEPYYLFPAVFMCIFATRRERYFWLGALAFVLALVSSMFCLPVGGGDPVVPLEGAQLLLPICITLGVYGILVYTAWSQLGERELLS